MLASVNHDLELLGYSTKGSMLDLGSGCGTFVKVCRSYGIEAIGVDPGEDLIEIAKEYEFGLTGRPSSILVVLFEGEEVFSYIGSYKFYSMIDYLRPTVSRIEKYPVSLLRTLVEYFDLLSYHSA